MLLIKEFNGNKVYAKSGWGDVEPQVGWLTGWVENLMEKKLPFSKHRNEARMPGSIRNEITYKSLENLGII